MDFLQLDEDKLTDVQGAASVLPSRGWTDDLCVGTGTTYLSGTSYSYSIHVQVSRLMIAGLGIGGAWGFKEGFSRPLGNNTSFKLRLNSVLNGCTRRGTFVGNSLGVLGEHSI
jgi:import inner membrane translocase subunit TIM23